MHERRWSISSRLFLSKIALRMSNAGGLDATYKVEHLSLKGAYLRLM
jgi:hypothetical protein